jgi:hypothetical protein
LTAVPVTQLRQLAAAPSFVIIQQEAVSSSQGQVHFCVVNLAAG